VVNKLQKSLDSVVDRFLARQVLSACLLSGARRRGPAACTLTRQLAPRPAVDVAKGAHHLHVGCNGGR
jgi:hypothetical protein